MLLRLIRAGLDFFNKPFLFFCTLYVVMVDPEASSLTVFLEWPPPSSGQGYVRALQPFNSSRPTKKTI
jgi:hypothetical protein